MEGFGSVENLRNWYDTVINERHACVTHAPVYQATQESYETWFNYLDGLVDNVVSYIHYNQIRTQSEESRSKLFRASIVAAVALLGFAWAANPKAEQAAVVLQSPTSAAALKLTDQGKSVLSPVIGAQCAAQDRIDVIVLNVATTGSDVITLKSKNCQLARFTISDALGRLTPTAP